MRLLVSPPTAKEVGDDVIFPHLRAELGHQIGSPEDAPSLLIKKRKKAPGLERRRENETLIKLEKESLW
jgi:hypothetical protein